MVFIGFGFLMAFLQRYGFSSVGFTFLLAAFALQWATLVQGFFHSFHGGHIHVGVERWAAVASLAPPRSRPLPKSPTSSPVPQVCSLTRFLTHQLMYLRCPDYSRCLISSRIPGPHTGYTAPFGPLLSKGVGRIDGFMGNNRVQRNSWLEIWVFHAW